MSAEKKKVVPEKKVLCELNLRTLVNSIKKFESFNESNLDEIKEYLNNELSRDTAQTQLDILNEIYKSLDNLNLEEDNKISFKGIMTFIISKCVESESRCLLIDSINNEKIAYLKAINEMRVAWQKERDEHNVLLAELKRELKPKIIEDIDIDVKISSVDGKKLNLTAKRFNALVEGVKKEKLSFDKYTRIPAQKEITGVDRAHAKLKHK